ncbi:sensor histidine kinase [Pseudomarimonas arenosa]|uniref:histidine kinase n=1 Tax=Pseudomarimonas arenosa TaxID=2774145 RepID=A0AAW3ZPZ7_9GAMM|nr:HAMP domain-containing sensor histidine kinase [Pseudomarimonas arenosa]MBD8526391.1 HAMP domain-containing histidine kinase [Pseudomarimonas arenosa]
MSLQRRLMLAFAGFAVCVAALFGMYAFLFVYFVEDRFFSAMLKEEAEQLMQAHARDGQWPTPSRPFMRLYHDPATFPPEVREVYREEPQRIEFSGAEGRHYHLLRLPVEPPVYLLAEVGQQLVVRPIRTQLLQVLAWSGTAVLALALLLGHLLARRAAAPIVHLADRVDALDPARLPSRFTVGDADADAEVGVLSRGLDALVRRIHAFVEREQAFVRDASHELRTPLTVIRMASTRLSEQTDLSNAAHAHLEQIRQSSQALEHIVMCLLSLAREEALPTQPEPIAILPVLERVIVDQSTVLEGKQVEIEISVAPEAKVSLPTPVLQMLLANLIGNAFAHTDQGSVQIQFRDRRLQVINTGHPIDDDLAARLYEPFSRSKISAGAGLGLAIVRRLCDRYHVELCVDSDQRNTIASIQFA